MTHSPLGLYYFFGGYVVHSDDGPEAAQRWLELNDGEELELEPVGAIQPDSRVVYAPDVVLAQALYFNAKTRRIETKNTSEGLVFAADELIGPHGWQVYAAYNSKPHKLHCFVAEAKLDAYMAAFEAVSGGE
jgi:hypothetical protein